MNVSFKRRKEKKDMYVIKRSGQQAPFHKEAIMDAVFKAANATQNGYKELDSLKAEYIAASVEQECEKFQHAPHVEEIQDLVIRKLQEIGAYDTAKNYAVYRYQRELVRKANSTDDQIASLIDDSNEEIKGENSNKNPILHSTTRDYIAGIVSKDITSRLLLPQDVVEAHNDGLIHFHDSDYFLQKMYNCCLVNLEDMLQNGTVISGTQITKPKSFLTACNIAAQIVAQVASNQYGGQTISAAHLAPFVDISRQKIREDVREEMREEGDAVDEAKVARIAERRLMKEVKSGVQTLNYQLLTLMTTNGQTPFVTVFLYIDEAAEGQTRDDQVLIIEEILNQRIKGMPDENGVWITPAFPKLIYVMDEDNSTEGSKYWATTQLASKCTAKRMVPDYISAKKMREYKGAVYPCMGCRSFLTPDRTTENVANANNYVPGHKYYGRFNQGVVTLNLVDVACSSDGDENRFWEILNERLELCHKALRCRHERLLGTTSDVAPILFQYGAIARLKKHEKIDKLLFGGYSTISLGYAGLYECTYYMTHASHTGEGKDFALRVMQALNDACAKWKEAENIDYSVYGTPLESTTYKFAKALRRRFGVIPGVTDKDYITNSYHVHVTEKIDAFKKLAFESEFQKLSPGGAISYVEVPDLQSNLPAVLSIMQFIGDRIMYAELNTKSDLCEKCGYDGEIQIVTDDHGKLVWECPNCHCRDQAFLHVARRTCGYIGTQFWNQGRTQEIKERVLHVSQSALSA